MGNKISVFEESIDEDFSNFISKNMKDNQVFSITNMIDFFSKTKKKYNLGKILQQLKHKGLVNELNDSIDRLKQKQSILIVNLTDILDQELLKISKELEFKKPLTLINGLKQKSDNKNWYEQLEKVSIQDNQTVFVISDFHHKYKVSELNLYFFKKGIFWCPIIIDDYGGYIGPLIHSVPSGPCWSCYEEKMYFVNQSSNKINKPPVLLNIFLRVALFEAFKVETNISPSQVIYSNLLEIDCWNCRSRKHYIYTDSDCPVCGV